MQKIKALSTAITAATLTYRLANVSVLIFSLGYYLYTTNKRRRAQREERN